MLHAGAACRRRLACPLVLPTHRAPPPALPSPSLPARPPRRKALVLKALGPLTVCVLSIALMNIFGWYDTPSKEKPYIKSIGKIPKG